MAQPNTLTVILININSLYLGGQGYANTDFTRRAPELNGNSLILNE